MNKIFFIFFVFSYMCNAENLSNKIAQLDYKAGAIEKVIGSKKGDTSIAKIGIKWGGVSQCNGFDLDFSIINQLNSGDVARLQNQAMSAFYQAFDPVNLAGKVLKDANPDLYEMLQNGIMQAQLKFDSSILKCENIQEKFLDMLPEGSISQAANADKLRDTALSGRTDIVKTISNLNGGDLGINLSNKAGKRVGGKNQPPIKPIEIITREGFNGLLKRDPDDISRVNLSIIKSNRLALAFPTPSSVNDYLVEILGDVSIRSCDKCKQERTVPNGFYNKIESESLKVKEQLKTILIKPISLITDKEISLFNKNNILKINRKIIIALKNLDNTHFIKYLEAISWDIAFATEVDKLLLAKKVLIAGKTVAKAAEIENIKNEIENKIALLNDELSSIKQELELKNIIQNSTIDVLLEREAIVSSKKLQFNTKGDLYE